jgi:hypothetical protein
MAVALPIAPRRTVGPWTRRARFGVLVALANLTLFNAYQVFRSVNPWPDFVYFLTFAKVGLTYGEPRLYDPALQQAVLHAQFPGAPFLGDVVNPPPLAWLLAPLTLVPYDLALWIWTASMIAALAVSSQLLAPPGRYTRALYAASLLGFLPAYLLVVSAPLAPLVVLSVVLAWKLIRDDHEVAAGLVLAIGLLKPTLAVLVPFALLAAGHRRLFLSWLVAAIVLVLASAASIGPNGIKSYIAASASFASNPYYLRWSLVPFLGDGIAWVAAVLVIAGATMWIAWRHRRDGPEPVIAVGVMGSILVNHHMTPGDLMMLLAPIWMLARIPGGLVRAFLVGLAWVGGWLAMIFPATALVVAATMEVVLIRRDRPHGDLQPRGADIDLR